jgi:hypothetical protein
MKTCKVCGNPKSHYVLNNRTVCLKCDDLVFDVEIECDENQGEKQHKSNEKALEYPKFRKVNIPAKK